MDRKTFDLAVFLVMVCLLPLAISGCQKEGIQSYDVPKVVEITDTPTFRDGPKERMLAAVIPHDDEVWFLKLQGPEADISAHKAEFDEVLRSFHFVDKPDEPAAWTTPKGWTVKPKTEMRYATLELDDKKTHLELSVTRLPGGGGMVVPNINRWRKQLGLNPVSAIELHKVTTEVKTPSGPAVAIDIVGVPSAAAAMKPPGHEAMEAAQKEDKQEAKPFEYQVPNGWIVIPDKGGPIRTEASFGIVEGREKAAVTVTRLPGESGSMPMNIARWRGQLGLPEGKPEEMKPTGVVTVGGIPSPFIDLATPKGNLDSRRMLIAVVTQGNSTWYFKMLGSADLVARQKATFEAFMASVRFQGGSHG